MPKVSIIVPVYGVEQYIERCARSLFEQTLDDIEYLFIDDCTLDNSIDILKQVLEEYPQRKEQVIIHRMEKNSGQAAVRKWGMLNATGDYVIHCDSDDWVDITMYEKMHNKAVEEDSNLVVCGYNSTNGNEILMSTLPDEQTFHSFCKNILVGRTSGALWNKLVSRNLINQIDYPEGNMGEDMVIILQCLFHSQRISIIREPLYSYFFNENSITRKQTEESIIYKFHESQKNADILIDFFKDNGLYDTYLKEIEVLLFNKKNALKPLLKKTKYYRLWKQSYKDINHTIIFNSMIPLKSRINYMLNYIRFNI